MPRAVGRACGACRAKSDCWVLGSVSAGSFVFTFAIEDARNRAERLPLDHPDFDPNPDSAPQGHGGHPGLCAGSLSPIATETRTRPVFFMFSPDADATPSCLLLRLVTSLGRRPSASRRVLHWLVLRRCFRRSSGPSPWCPVGVVVVFE
eukprot:scaffold4238_cov105-Isochrysis_galbana.AAC.13